MGSFSPIGTSATVFKAGIFRSTRKSCNPNRPSALPPLRWVRRGG
jgi:hypothetical protein